MRSTENDRLIRFVRLVPANTSARLSVTRTVHLWPARWLSTLNSSSIRPVSCLAFITQEECQRAAPRSSR